MTKTKDLFLNIVTNPNMTLQDLVSVGITSENTMLLDRAQYASNEKIQNMFRDEEGNFDENKFNEWYDIAEQSYNILANDEVNLNLIDITAYDSDNIFVDPSKRRQKNEPFVLKLPNPDRLNVGITRIDKIGPRTLSQDEIAQSQKTLLNPVAVANGEKPIYGDSPNGSWFKDFWDTKVMAAWDEDGTHVDPITGQEMSHKKGDLKLNENGTYYYESLDGRSVYGKRILNKFNTLTTDGSSWNKYDFFDSDDIEQKSIGGSIAKNLALVGSMFIPYVGWGVAAASIAHQMTGLTATFGKMLAGADNPTLNAIEGWVKSTDRKHLKTEYAQQNMWCWENFINLIGDVTAQLREQRAIFKFAPGIIKRDFKPLSDKKITEYTEKLAKEGLENATNLSFKDIVKLAHTQNPKNARKQLELLMKGASDIYSERAQKLVRKYLDDYYKLGEPIAKAYMTAITVQDTFGEAIEAGATNNEATLLTLGYAAAEAALLSTDLGKWIMPELRANRQRYKMIAKKILELPQETREISKQISKLSGETKKEWAKRLFNIGKDIARAEYSMLPKTIGSVLASGLGEGVEEVSEELLADFSKSCFNLSQQLQGDDTRMSAWDNMGSRYGMSFVGGIMGGSINAAASDYNQNKALYNMTSEQALQQLVYMTRNNELDDFWKAINKTTLASKELSTQVNENGIGYKPGTKNDNQDLEAKKFIEYNIKTIESIINSEGAKLNDSGLLSTLIKADPSLKDLDPVKEYRMRALSNSATAGRILNEWNTISTDILKNRLEQNKIINKYGDSNSEKYSEEDKEQLKKLSKDLKELQKRKDGILNGERTREYVRDAMFEMTYGVNETWNDLFSEVRYVESKTGKKYSDISEPEKQKLKEQYEQIKNSTEYAEKIHELANIYETIAILASQGIQESSEFYKRFQLDKYTHVKNLNEVIKSRFDVLERLLKNKDTGVISIQEILNDKYRYDLVLFEKSEELIQEIDNHYKWLSEEKEKIRSGRQDTLLSSDEKDLLSEKDKQANYRIGLSIFNSVYDSFIETCDEFLKIGFIHPEIKHYLSQMGESLKEKAFDEKYNEEDREIPYNINNDLRSNIFSNKKKLPYAPRYDELESKLKEIEKLSNTPIIENLSKFQLSTSIDKTVLDLLSYLQTEEFKNSKDIASFQLDNVTLQNIKDAKNLLNMYKSAIVGARYDNIDIDTIIGFNTTLNELTNKEGFPKLAEIDGQTSDLILEDINKLESRLDYFESLHNLNSGNKYNTQDKTALNKQFIIFNKTKSFISILEDDDDWNKTDSFIKLKQLINSDSPFLTKNSGFGKNYKDRIFSLSVDDKTKIERESIALQQALHDFFNDNIDISSDILREASVNKLAKILTYNNFKGLIRENNEYLESNSEDMDDSAFIWWLCSTAALSSDQFYNNYRTILGTETDGEKPIAPIPTQELGIFAATAAIINGEMFKVFGEAIHKSLSEYWNSISETERVNIQNESESSFISSNKNKDYFKNNDFLPNFNNILFIEGIAGSGKTSGVLKTLFKLLNKTNPEFTSKKILIAHTNKLKGNKLGKSLNLTNFEAHDHDSLLSYMSADYQPVSTSEGTYKYTLGKDVFLSDGLFRANWKVRSYQDSEVPKLIVIDEWSHYNQIEQDLIQRFAQCYGITVIATGDYDQLTPISEIRLPDGSDMGLLPHRNMTARVAKLGVSMRTDNNLKTGNTYRMLAWAKNPSQTPIQLHYYEDNTGIYGDKLYHVDSSYGNQLQNIQNDVKKMISTLKESKDSEKNKIGYIYHSAKSELYQWLTTTEGIKEYINPMLEKDAHGEEAQYYIVENSRDDNQDTLSYFKSVYTGITRSEQGSIFIASNNYIAHKRDKETGNPIMPKDKFNKSSIKFESTLASEIKPDTYSEEGTKNFTKKRKDSLDEIYKNQEIIPFNIKEKLRKPDPLNIQTSNKPSSNQQSSQNQQLSQNEQSNNPLNPEEFRPTNEEISELLPVARTDEEVKEEQTEESWEGPLKKGQHFYNEDCEMFQIIGEEEDYYIINDISSDEKVKIPKKEIHETCFERLPNESKLLNVGDHFIYNNEKYVINKIVIRGDFNNPFWLYITDKGDIKQNDLKTILEKSNTVVIESENTPLEAKPSEYEVGSRQDYEEAVNEEFSNDYPIAVNQNPESNDINFNLFGFTFNTQYFADEFDDQGNIKPTDDKRIDCGYGLNKINPNKFKSKASIEQAMGSIRQYLYFKSNSDIVNYISKLTGKNDLSIRWGFISKTDKNDNSYYNRFNASKSNIEYTQQDGVRVHKKSLSAIIFDNTTSEPILEIPLIMLQSPHSIFNQMISAGIGYDVTSIWATKTKKEDTYIILQKIYDYISKNKKGLKGYESLNALIRLWLFTSNGVKFLPKDWNLHTDTENLGNLFITQRFADDVPEFNFLGNWDNLPKLQRKDRFISSIFMNNDDYYETPSGQLFKTFKAYTPYVIISDSPDITNDVDAVNQYLKQITTPGEEEKVTLVPVSCPEISVSQYIQEMYRLITRDPSDKTPIPYGNTYSSYRIWQAIFNSSNKEYIMSKLKKDQKDEVIKIMKMLNDAELSINPNSFERKLDYQKAVARKLNEINAQSSAFSKLRKFLVKTCYYDTFGQDDYLNINILNSIQQISNQAGITGITCKAQFAYAKKDGINKFAHKVKVDSDDKFKFFGQGYFRIYGKIDPPTYNLNSIQNHIKNWVSDISLGRTVKNPNTGEIKYYPNIWSFNNKYDEDLYLSKKSMLDLKSILSSYKNLLGKLNLSEYIIDTYMFEDYISENQVRDKILKIIHEEYKKIPGAFILEINGIYKYGNIDPNQSSELKGYLFRGITQNNGNYLLEFYNNTDIKQIELELDLKNNSFYISNSPRIQQQSFEQTIEEVKSLKNLEFFKGSSQEKEIINVVDQILDSFNSGTFNSQVLTQILEESNLDNLTRIMIESTIPLDNIENQNLDCVIPTKINFII